jgi:tetratricopeptide (TPR) repeat protein
MGIGLGFSAASPYKANPTRMANPNWKLTLLRALMIVAAGFWVFAPTLHGDWLMDDDTYITQNALLNDPHRLWKTWFAPGSLIEYYPLTATVQAAEWSLWHMDTLGYHLVNLALHLMSALLVWLLLSKLGVRLAWLGGFLFAVHPIVVESVAWISELKNTLSLPPFLLAMCVWIDFDERRRPQDYLLSLGLFVVAMLGKISVAPFPLAILLYAWWKRDRVGWRDINLAAPFFVVSLALSSVCTLAATWFREAHWQPAITPELTGLGSRLVIAGLVLAYYLSKVLFPFEMLPVYPKWPDNPSAFASLLIWLALAALIFWFWHKRATWGRHALLGLGFFLINLIPVVAFIVARYENMVWSLDHLGYLPVIGLIGLAVAGLGQLEDCLSQWERAGLVMSAAIVLALLAFESENYASKFAGPEKLWTYTVERNPTSWLVHNNLGDALLEHDRTAEAIEQYRAALQLNPNMEEAHNNLGVALREQGDTADAIEQFTLALQTDPHLLTALTNLGDELVLTGRGVEAGPYYKRALEVNPGDDATKAKLAKLEPARAKDR